MNLTRYRDNVTPLRFSWQFAMERALPQILDQIADVRRKGAFDRFYPQGNVHADVHRGDQGG